MVKMKNISFIVILLFSSIIYAQENSEMNVVFKINIDFNGKPDINKKYDMLVINYSDEQIDRYDSSLQKLTFLNGRIMGKLTKVFL